VVEVADELSHSARELAEQFEAHQPAERREDQAHERAERGHIQGKIVLRVAGD
jgi:hypothetical protein